MKSKVVPRALSLAILAFQLYIPWSVKHLVTQDGPAHIYTAFVTKDLIFHRHTSPYHELYRVQKKPLPNWTCTLLLAGILSVFGPNYAEAILMTLCLLVGYGSFAYCIGSLSQRGSPLLFANWLMQSWFLWAGFYNFYLGMMLVPLVIGIYLRHRERLVILSGSLVLLFFTHLVPAALALLTLGILGIWMRRGWKLALALAPAAILIGAYIFNFKGDTQYSPDILSAFKTFPQKVFVFSLGWVGEQRSVWVAVVLIMLLAVFLMSRQEWKSPLGALALTTLACFMLYLLAPDVGFGGSVVKMRFAFAVFLFGSLLICSVERLRVWTPWIGIALAILLVAQLIDVAQQVRRNSDGVENYLAAMDKLPVGSGFVRMYFPAPYAMHRWGMDRLAFHPLLHVDELGAVRRHAVDLSDYQSATGTFSIDIKPSVDDGHRHSLGFETPGGDAWAIVEWLNGGLPVPIDHIVYFGDEAPGSEAPVKYIGATSGVRVYELVKRQP